MALSVKTSATESFMKNTFCAVSVGFLLSMSVQADTPASTTPVPTAYPSIGSAKPAVDPNKLICKRIQKIGSLFPAKMCATKAQWDQMTASGRDVIDSAQRSPNNPPQY
jgi:hypothetical protein